MFTFSSYAYACAEPPRNPHCAASTSSKFLKELIFKYFMIQDTNISTDGFCTDFNTV